jgi:hypothetical protein
MQYFYTGSSTDLYQLLDALVGRLEGGGQGENGCSTTSNHVTSGSTPTTTSTTTISMLELIEVFRRIVKNVRYLGVAERELYQALAQWWVLNPRVDRSLVNSSHYWSAPFISEDFISQWLMVSHESFISQKQQQSPGNKTLSQHKTRPQPPQNKIQQQQRLQQKEQQQQSIPTTPSFSLNDLQQWSYTDCERVQCLHRYLDGRQRPNVAETQSNAATDLPRCSDLLFDYLKRYNNYNTIDVCNYFISQR